MWNTTLAGLIFVLSAGIIGAVGARQIGRTTLAGPWIWTLIVLLFAAGVELAIRTGDPTLSLPVALRYTAGVGLLLPMVSLLGAKRPQDKAWHLIVLTLWGVLILPAAESYFIRQGSTLHIHDARGWFLWVLIVTGWLNHVATRYSLESSLYSLAVVLSLAPHLPLLRWTQSYPLLASCLTLFASIRMLLHSRRRRDDFSLDGLWRDFRDSYGAVWGLRVAERVNATSESSGGGGRLAWSGFEWNNADDQQRKAVVRTLRSLVLRFTSEDWWDQRMGTDN